MEEEEEKKKKSGMRCAKQKAVAQAAQVTMGWAEPSSWIWPEGHEGHRMKFGMSSTVWFKESEMCLYRN